MLLVASGVNVRTPLSGGFVAPETYKKYELNEETKEHEYVDIPHPYFGQTPPSFADKIIFIMI